MTIFVMFVILFCVDLPMPREFDPMELTIAPFDHAVHCWLNGTIKNPSVEWDSVAVSIENTIEYRWGRNRLEWMALSTEARRNSLAWHYLQMAHGERGAMRLYWLKTLRNHIGQSQYEFGIMPPFPNVVNH